MALECTTEGECGSEGGSNVSGSPRTMGHIIVRQRGGGCKYGVQCVGVDHMVVGLEGIRTLLDEERTVHWEPRLVIVHRRPMEANFRHE